MDMYGLKIKPKVGSYVETIHGVNGILMDIKPTYYGDMAFIATADVRTFHCPVCDIRRDDNERKAAD